MTYLSDSDAMKSRSGARCYRRCLCSGPPDAGDPRAPCDKSNSHVATVIQVGPTTDLLTQSTGAGCERGLALASPATSMASFRKTPICTEIAHESHHVPTDPALRNEAKSTSHAP